jgi:hypothetical protein
MATTTFAELYTDAYDDWRWRILRGGRTVAESGGSFSRKASAVTSVNRLADAFGGWKWGPFEEPNDGRPALFVARLIPPGRIARPVEEAGSVSAIRLGMPGTFSGDELRQHILRTRR